MGRVENDGPLELLRRANAHFGGFFERFAAAPVMGSYEEVEALLQVECTLHAGRRLARWAATEERRPRGPPGTGPLSREPSPPAPRLANMQESAVGCRARLYSARSICTRPKPGVPPRERLVEFGRAEVARFCDESPLTCGWRQRPSISPHSLLRTSVSLIQTD